MEITPKPRDRRIRHIGRGKPRALQLGELTFDRDDATLQTMINQGLPASGTYLPLGGGTLSGNLTLNNVNIVLAAGAGTKIGTATSQKLGFYNATPVDQPATVADPTGGGTQDAEARTAINALIDRLQELGLIA